MQPDSTSQTPVPTPSRAVPQPIPEDSRQFPIGGDGLNEQRCTLTERQQAAIGLLLSGKAIGAIARTLEIDPKTLYNWRQDDAFRDELRRRCDESWGAAFDRLRALVHPSLDVLETELSDRYDRTRHRAAAAILRMSNLGRGRSSWDA